jgi:flagellar hook-associated protein 3 FlgL
MHATAGSGSYVTAAAAGNTGTALISQPTVTNLQGSYVGKAFDVQFAMSADPIPVLQYTVNVLDASGGTVVATSAPVDYVAGTTSLDLGGGVQVSFTGTPQAGDAFSVEPANARYVASPSLQAGSTLAVGATSVSDSTAAYFGKPFSIAFDDATNFTVTYYSDSSLATPVGTTTGVYAAPGTISIPGSGLSIDMAGVPVAGDKVTVQPSQPTNLNIFDTLDSIISSLDTPLTGSDSGQAAFLNNLAGAIQRIDLNYNQVLSVRSSVGTRLNELDAIDSNGTLRNLGYTSQLSKLEDVDYYTATAQLQLRQSALQAAATAFKQIQGTSLFNMGSN